ncbi:MAG: hypothetical protein JWM00_579 [Candidatus Saccharibacteria bacterium]|nr:hypothetical protein [Candidatus Saccharibacteria bacterium]
MNISQLFTLIIKRISSFFGRYHFIIMLVYLVGSASYAILLIADTVALSDEPNGYVSQANDTTFDEDTISRLRQLKSNNQETDKLPVAGRTSPF